MFEIGASLREARETRGLTLEDVQKALRFEPNKGRKARAEDRNDPRRPVELVILRASAGLTARRSSAASWAAARRSATASTGRSGSKSEDRAPSTSRSEAGRCTGFREPRRIPC